MATRQRVVVVGGGFGGLQAVLGLRHAEVDVTLVDRRNFHLFQPLLYQVATGGLSPANVCAPLRALLKRQGNVTVLLGEVVDFDLAARQVVLGDGVLPFDWLIVATGARHHYFGHPAWESLAPGLKTIEDATESRRRILVAFEMAELHPETAMADGWLTFAVVGAGPTGVELAGSIAELAQHTLRANFRRFDPAEARILLVEATDRVLPPYAPKLSAKAESALRRMRVDVRLGTSVTALSPETVTLRHGDATETLPCRTVLWAAGVQASPLAKLLADRTAATLDRAGRVHVRPDLTLPGRDDVFVIGDMAHCVDAAGKPLPGVAPVAMQQGRHVADAIRCRVPGRSVPAFRYVDRGSMATIGRAAAVADLKWIQCAGYPAWLAWLFIHLLMIVQFENRLLVLTQWAWNYLTRNRSARLITGTPPAPHSPTPAHPVS